MMLHFMLKMPHITSIILRDVREIYCVLLLHDYNFLRAITEIYCMYFAA